MWLKCNDPEREQAVVISFMAIPRRDVEAPVGSIEHIVLRRGWWRRSPYWRVRLTEISRCSGDVVYSWIGPLIPYRLGRV